MATSIAPSGFSYQYSMAGDAWDSMAFRWYGSEVLLTLLLDANPGLNHTIIFDAGTQILVPQASPVTTLPAPPWRTIQQLG
jgi:phage tail protein X